MRHFSRLLTVVMVAAFAAACSGDFASDLMSPDDASFTSTTTTGRVIVGKVGPDGTYQFEASENPETGYLKYPSFELDAGERLDIWAAHDETVSASVTVKELPSPGTQVDSIRVRIFVSGNLESETVYYGTDVVEVEEVNNRAVQIKFFNSETPSDGGEGCTPGYWRQDQHFDSWTDYSPSDMYDDVFGVTYGGSLLDAVWAKGGGVDALARHSVAALLNAASPGVDYPATESQVISAVQNAFASAEYELTKDMFEGWNEAGCELD